MAGKPSISLPDQSYELAQSLVAKGRFASLSAVVQHGLALVAREEREHDSRLAAIAADLERRAAQPSIRTEEMDHRLASWRAERDAADPTDLA